MLESYLHIENLAVRFRNKTILDSLYWQINKGEQWLLKGTSGSGKTILAKAIAGLIHTSGTITIKYFNGSMPRILYVAQWFPFKDKRGTTTFYYQQRFNSSESEDCNTVWDEMISSSHKEDEDYDDELNILKEFDLLHRKNTPLLQLSSGEQKKLQICKAFILKPQWLILDNPYTGLDVSMRQNLNKILDQRCNEGMQLILISNDGIVPSCINRFASLENGKIKVSLTNKESNEFFFEEKKVVVIPEFLKTNDVNFDDIVRLKEVNIKYGNQYILNKLNWTINKGEKWVLQGPNGSGKSTLLSLLTGDHPQAYANDIWLFGKKRGTGESIWDIKKNIGFISPELQWYFEPSSTIFHTIASGLFDTSGLFRAVSDIQAKKVRQLLHFFGLEEKEDTILKQLSLGKQRLALLARAVIKNPILLILDEPCQGLDEYQTLLFNNLVDTICTEHRSLIYVSHFEHQLPNCITDQFILTNG